MVICSITDNPAARLIKFSDNSFLRMSCGGMLLETKKTCEQSPRLRRQGPCQCRGHQGIHELGEAHGLPARDTADRSLTCTLYADANFESERYLRMKST